ncbi:DMT family transporter [Daeguia caeni]|uniref:DMT family transporter n=1 Tax=Daeguia caeni TaxID=439612 RepID=A0ABV9H802_9HYPH
MSSDKPTQTEARLRSIDLIGLLLLALPPLFWAGNFIAGRAMQGTVPPMALSFWRWVIALIVLLPFGLAAMRRDLAKYWAYRWRIIAISITGVFAFNSLVYAGLQTTTASNGLLLNSFIPILVVLFAALFYGQRISAGQACGLALSFAGVLTIIMHGDWTRLIALTFSTGDLIIFCAMISWAFYTLWLRGIPADINRVGLLIVQIIVALFLLVPLYLWERASGAETIINAHSLAALAYIGLFPSVIAYLLYNFAVARLGAAQAGLSIHLMPMFGVVLAIIFLDETIHLYHVIGISAIIFGIVIASRKKAVRAKAA